MRRRTPEEILEALLRAADLRERILKAPLGASVTALIQEYRQLCGSKRWLSYKLRRLRKLREEDSPTLKRLLDAVLGAEEGQRLEEGCKPGEG